MKNLFNKAKIHAYYGAAAFFAILAAASVGPASLSWIHSPEPPAELLK